MTDDDRASMDEACKRLPLDALAYLAKRVSTEIRSRLFEQTDEQVTGRLTVRRPVRGIDVPVPSQPQAKRGSLAALAFIREANAGFPNSRIADL